MNQEKLDLLVRAGNNFYLNIGENPGITDEHYDQLKDEYESETGLSVMELFDFPKDKSGDGPLLNSLDKVKLMPEEVKSSILEFIGMDPKSKKEEWNKKYPYIINYKHDGSSIAGIYKDGILIDIKSTPSDPTQACKMKNFYEFFPHKIEDKTITLITGEVLVSTSEYGEKARQNANACVNAKRNEKIREVKNHAFIRAYYVLHEDGEYNFDRLNKDLIELSKYNNNLFKVAERLTPDDITTDSYMVTTPMYKDQIMIDGYVVYTDGGIKGFKFKCMDYVDVTVTGIEYNYMEDNGNYVPIIKFNPFMYQGTERRSLNPGGINVLLKSGLNIGSTFRYIGIGNTIPGIAKDENGERIVYSHGEGYVPYEELTPEITKSIYKFPVCECGTQLTMDGIYDSNLYCTNPLCIKRFEAMKSRFLTMEHRDNLIEMVLNLVNVNGITTSKYYDRFNDSKFRDLLATSGIKSEVLDGQRLSFYEWIKLPEFVDKLDYKSDIEIDKIFIDEVKDILTGDKLKVLELGIKPALIIIYNYLTNK